MLQVHIIIEHLFCQYLFHPFYVVCFFSPYKWSIPSQHRRFYIHFSRSDRQRILCPDIYRQQKTLPIL